MPSGAGGRPPPSKSADAPAEHLAALIPPLRFASRDGFAALPRLSGFAELLRGAVARARTAGAPPSPALDGLAAEGAGFEALPPAEKQRALLRIAGHLSSLIAVPEELRELAARGRVEVRGPATAATDDERRSDPSALSVAPPEVARSRRASTPTSTVNPNPTAVERKGRRAALSQPLAQLPRAHPAPRALLEERGYLTVEQALSFWPKAYQDRTRTRPIAELRTGDTGLAVATVRGSKQARMKSGKPLLKVEVADQSGRLDLVFFNPPPWRLKQFPAGESLLVSGKLTEGFGGRRQMSQPEVEKLAPGDSANFGRVVPFYAGPADYQHPALRKLMKRLCDELAPLAVDDLPPELRARRGLIGIGDALREAHFPPEGTDPAQAADRSIPAFRRLVFEELFFLQLALALRRRGVRREPGIAFEAGPDRVAEVMALVPFTFTGAQRRSLDEIARDMARPEPMHRLLQGDVGSGKTAVAFAAMMLAVRSGYQAALMAPTEILAEQHARTMGRWLEGSGVELALVAAQARGKAQRDARAALASGRARLAVGTHALLEEEVGLDRLGLVVVDEQHRFGVLQRAKLIGKGTRPDVLVMTATPIPRTLALAFYGDLDQSKIDELPPGRTPVETKVFGDSQRRKAYEVARRELCAGRQAYVVYPLVAESEKTDLADATSGAAELTHVFPGHEVGLVHGQMKGEEKDAVMQRFRAGEIAVLVATTVIEVGVDVPNASVMIVEHAERFGLSQLHQLRGRVGRGAAKSFCLLLAHFKRTSDEARERLRVMEATQDGFEIARADLRLRGPGELLGTRQSGQKLFEIADLYRDETILEEARADAFALVEADPALRRPEHVPAAEALRERWAGRLSLAQIG
ncbi:MAG TPA: ATP-dependent DNA helicase RecG [Anaeromyxobacteraceae bacterium]|nr:ATP-dependent DNA helicase RecG [Anaeromyxobacteraceae bacterium]